ncbi:cupredoxin domain-containing protein [Lacticaseibacillus manihotivorans]|jgi:plastocyanin domain-containing protein|uniref:EfeO-type cupredoxin-like domain-containing protein n=2 Tax=Lacticaseibacillus manihotivorans TaxID=88233 RepID=A0A0R1R5V9_9LACO|nr:cupredoxin domain-containing protein [Lacticaseibacillus manihotivorans]KRL52422.1 hypothetical protein FD01_GL002397 [Lacticaseibacillus manihotivorans DSM 13343 = JCM 12514]QFQ90594.1 cupredoxin domain-containing protein [Lacticaseibacillus manihotivorans]
MKEIQNINITVDGGYEPETVTAKQGVPTTLTFTRTNTQGCLDVVHSKDFNFETELPIDQTQTVDIDTSKPGTFTYSCGMDMFFGHVEVK